MNAAETDDRCTDDDLRNFIEMSPSMSNPQTLKLLGEAICQADVQRANCSPRHHSQGLCLWIHVLDASQIFYACSVFLKILFLIRNLDVVSYQQLRKVSDFRQHMRNGVC
jgi:hypothetical protein